MMYEGRYSSSAEVLAAGGSWWREFLCDGSLSEELLGYERPVLGNFRGLRVFDLGGGWGTHYYRFRKAGVDVPWMVCELSGMLEGGRRLADERGAGNLGFTDQPFLLVDYDTFHSSGALQYIENWPFVAGENPRDVFITQMPVTDNETFFTIQEERGQHLAVRVFNEGQFVEYFRMLGYKMVDSWDCYEVPELCGFRGFYFKR